jgi:hypothetical protein
MSIERNFRELFSQTVTLFPPTSSSSIDKYGKRSFSASASVSACAHYVSETVLRRTADGREVIEDGRFYLYGIFPVTTDYKLRLDDGAEPIIVAVDTPYDQNGAHHTVVHVGGKLQ